MGLLDELKQQAESVLVSQRTTEDNQNQKLQASHARMKAALHYWVEFVKAINIVKPVISRNYYLEGSTQLENLLQCDYDVNSRRITVLHQDYIDSIELRLRCASDTPITVQKESEVLVKRLREHLWQHGLKFDLREIRKEGAYIERGIFTIHSDVTVRLTMTADLDHSQITLTVRNLERLGEYSYVYDVDEFGSEVLDELGKAILGKPHKLRSMGRRQAEGVAAWPGPERRASDAP
jgi:hypothetical protein